MSRLRAWVTGVAGPFRGGGSPARGQAPWLAASWWSHGGRNGPDWTVWPKGRTGWPRATRAARRWTTVGPLPLRRQPDGFTALLDAIVGQQVSVASADAILARMEAAGLWSEAAVAAASDEELRAAGLSRQKARYAAALALARLDYDGLRGLPDDAGGVQGWWRCPASALDGRDLCDVRAGPGRCLCPRRSGLAGGGAVLFGLPERAQGARLARAGRGLERRGGRLRRALLWAYYRAARAGKESDDARADIRAARARRKARRGRWWCSCMAMAPMGPTFWAGRCAGAASAGRGFPRPRCARALRRQSLWPAVVSDPLAGRVQRGGGGRGAGARGRGSERLPRSARWPTRGWRRRRWRWSAFRQGAMMACMSPRAGRSGGGGGGGDFGSAAGARAAWAEVKVQARRSCWCMATRIRWCRFRTWNWPATALVAGGVPPMAM
jgi:DNA-3-methyladenine glycosylase II